MSDTTSTGETPAPAPRKRRWTLRVALGLVVLLVLLIVFAPTLLSTGPGNALVFNLMQSADLEVERGSLNVGWFGGQRLAAERLATADGGFEASGVELRARDASLFALARGGDVGDVPLTARSIVIRPARFDDGPAEPGEEGDREPRDRPDDGRADEPASLPKNLAGRVTFTADRVVVETPGEPDFEATGVEASLDVRSLRDVRLVLDGQLRRGDASGSLRGDLTVSDAADADGRLQLAALRLAGGVELLGVPVDAIEMLTGNDGWLTPLIGDRIEVVRLDAQGSADALDATLTLATPAIEQTTLRLTRDADTLALRTESPLRLTVTPAAAAALAGSGDAPSPITRDATLDVNLTRLAVPFDGDSRPDLDRLSIAAEASLSPTGLRLEGDRSIDLGAARFTVASGALAESLAVSLAGDATFDGTTRPLRLDAELRGVTTAMPSGTITAALPVALADALAEQDGRLLDTLGDELDTTLALTPAADGVVAYTLDLASGTLRGGFAGDVTTRDGTTVATLATSTPVSLTLDPGVALRWLEAVGQAEVASEPKLVLAEPLALRLEVPEATARFADRGDGVTFDPAGSSFRVVGGADRVALKKPDVDGQRVLEGVTLTAESSNVAELIELVAAAVLPTADFDEPLYAEADEALGPGRANATVTVREAFGAAGAPAFDTAPVDATATLDRAPTSLVDALLDADDQLLALLGPVTSGSLEANYRHAETTPVRLTLDATHAESTLPLVYDPSGWVTASGDATLELRPTEMTFETVLGEALPVLANAINSERPVMLTLDPQTLRIPVRDFDLGNARIDGKLDLGSLRMERDGWLAQTVGGVISSTLVGGRLGGGKRSNTDDAPVDPDAPTYLASFTPVSFSLQDGVATSSEFWLVADDLAVGFQESRVNVLTDDIEKLSMGVMGASFVAGSGGTLRPFIKADQIYTLPVSGKVSKPKIDTGWLVTELTGSIISGTLTETTGVGGAIFDIFGNAVRDARTRPLQLAWAPPEPALAFVQNVVTRDGARDPGEAQQPTAEELRDTRRERRDSILDELLERRDNRRSGDNN